MSPTTLKKLFFSLFFLFLPLLVYSQSNRAESVALLPFWGPGGPAPYNNEQIVQVIQEFGEELYKGVNEKEGFRSVLIDDMTNLPSDVSEGGNPPYICPPHTLVSNSVAITGEIIPDLEDEEYIHLRLYLWEMKDSRLISSDEVVGYERDQIARSMPKVLEWLFHWLKRSRMGSEGDYGEGDTSNLYGGKNTYLSTSMPLQWIYVGARVGASPLRLQEPPNWKEYDDLYVENRFESVNASVFGSIALFPEHIPFFSHFEVQAEATLNYDFAPYKNAKDSSSPASMRLTPAALLKFQVYRQGDMLFSLFGGAFTPFSFNDNIKFSNLIPIGWTAGLSFGGRLDPLPGIFFIDMRYSSDEFNTYVITEWDEEAYRRKTVTISLGYQFGFITKR